MGDWPNQSRLSALGIRQQVEGSLIRLQTDYIDMYQMHHIDRETPWQEIWQAMEVLVQQGEVLYVGSSNFAGWHIDKAQAAAKARHFMGLVSEQCLYNVKDRMVELEVLPACKDYGLGVIPWSPLAGGLLVGVLQKIKEGRRANKDTQNDVKKYRKQLEAWEKFCKQMGENPADVALAWLLANPVVTAPIIGPRLDVGGGAGDRGSGRWDLTAQAFYAAWIERLFDAPPDESLSFPSLAPVLRDPTRNFLHDYLRAGEDERLPAEPDCADLSYFLRAYFAWKLGLPIAYRSCSRGGRDSPPRCDGPTIERAFVGRPAPASTFREVSRRIMDTMHSGSGRTALGDDATDLYPVPLDRSALWPGTVYADPYGHTLIVRCR